MRKPTPWNLASIPIWNENTLIRSNQGNASHSQTGLTSLGLENGLGSGGQKGGEVCRGFRGTGGRQKRSGNYDRDMCAPQKSRPCQFMPRRSFSDSWTHVNFEYSIVLPRAPSTEFALPKSVFVWKENAKGKQSVYASDCAQMSVI